MFLKIILLLRTISCNLKPIVNSKLINFIIGELRSFAFYKTSWSICQLLFIA